MDVAGNTKFVELVEEDSVFEAGGGREGLFGYSTTQGTLRFQYGASPTANVAFMAIRNGANTFTGLQTLNAGITVAGGASKFNGLAGTGVRMATFAADGTLSVATDATTARSLIGALAESEKGAANGIAPLGSDSKIAATYLPSYVDDVIEVANFAALPGTGESGKIYVTLDTNKTYRWSGSAYVVISETLALGETSSTAYRGDRGKTAYDHSQITAGNPHGTTTAQVTEATNLYFTEARVRATPLTGYAVGSNSSLAASDTVLGAFGKVQAQINARPGTVTSVGLTAPANMAVSSSPVTGAGTLSLSWNGSSSNLVRADGSTISSNAFRLNGAAFVSNGNQGSGYVKFASITIPGGLLVARTLRWSLDGRELDGYLGRRSILTFAVRRNSDNSFAARFYLTDTGSDLTEEVTVRTNDGITWDFYIDGTSGGWCAFYWITPEINDMGAVTNTFVASTSMPSYSTVIVASRYGYAHRLLDARTFTIGSTGKPFNGTANLSWSLAEIGALSTVTGDTTSRTANTVYAAPNGSAGTAAFRALVAADIPSLSGIYQPLDSDLTAIAALSTQAFGRSLLTQADEAAARVVLGTKRKATVLRPSAASATPGNGVSTEVVWTTIQVDLDYIVDFWYYTGGGACTLRIYDGSQNSSKIFYSASLPASNAAYHMRICFQADTSAGAFVTINGVPEARAKTDLSLMTGTLIFTAQGNGGVGAYLVPGQLTYTQAG